MNTSEHLTNGAIVGGAIGALIGGVPEVPLAAILGFAGSLIPDIDAKRSLGIHRKTFHNLPFLAFLFLIAWFYPVFIYLPIGVASHYALDALYTRRGIALFYPFSREEYQTPGGVTVDDPKTPLITATMSVFEIGLLWILL